MTNIIRILLLTKLTMSTVLAAPDTGLPFATWTNAELVLNNGVIQRTIKLPGWEGIFLTKETKPVQGQFRI